MFPFDPIPLFEIPGLGAASGLVCHDNLLYLIADDATFLYTVDLSSQKTTRLPLSSHPAANIPKPSKPDFEAVALHGNQLYLFGSGSTSQRNSGTRIDLASHHFEHFDLSPLYARLQQTAGFDPENFNIEGAVSHENHWLLFQRGNGSGGQNGIFRLKHFDDPQPQWIPIVLPNIDGIPTAFTDAISVDGWIFFLAAAEDSASTYHDGQVKGSLIGRLHAGDFQLADSFVISRQHKFEGLTLWHTTHSTYELLLCEDPDKMGIPALLYQLSVPKPG